MPGVADKVRRTQLKQDQKQRMSEMGELVRMVKENRLHEADERQLEILKHIAELQKAFGPRSTVLVPTSPPPVELPSEVIELLKEAVREAVGSVSLSSTLLPQDDPARPAMRHMSLDLSQSGDDLAVSHSEGLGEEQKSSENAEDKLKKLKKIKG